MKINENNNKLQDPIFDPQVLNGVIEWRMPSLEPQTYRIGVGDVITLNMQLKESLGNVLNDLIASQNSQRGFKVQDDGAVSIPDIGRLVIGGLTLQEVESNIYQRLLEVGETPSFSIEIIEFNSQKISITGNDKITRNTANFFARPILGRGHIREWWFHCWGCILYYR